MAASCGISQVTSLAPATLLAHSAQRTFEAYADESGDSASDNPGRYIDGSLAPARFVETLVVQVPHADGKAVEEQIVIPP